MKTYKQLYLSVELVNRLQKEENQSSLVENVLKDYFERTDNPYLHMTQAERDLERKKLIIQVEADKKIKEIENGSTGQA